MYALAVGPLLWASVGLFVCGLIYKVATLIRLTEKKPVIFCTVTKAKDGPVSTVSSEERNLDRIARFHNSVLGKHPVMVIVSFVFHLCLFVTPLFLLAHNVMIRNAIGLSLPSMPEGLADFLTLTVLGSAVFFLVRRIAVPKVAAISDCFDYAVLLIAAAPFLTGFLAHHQILPYRTMLTAHILTGELMLVAIPFTKIGHMVFFFFARIAMDGEFCLGRGGRTWVAEER
jgi:nitrate reductase gamma subunit